MQGQPKRKKEEQQAGRKAPRMQRENDASSGSNSGARAAGGSSSADARRAAAAQHQPRTRPQGAASASWGLAAAVLVLVVATAVAWYAMVPSPGPVDTSKMDGKVASSDSGGLALDGEGELGELPHVWWFGPLLSGGGYCSEALSFVLELSKHTQVRITQHGDSISADFVNGLPAGVRSKLQRMLYNSVNISKTVVVCHSEAGAWYPPMYQTSICPPSGAKYVIGRTMFETDRIPSGWTERCNRDLMSEIWVPTDFHVESFSKSGVDRDKLIVMPESVDVDEFNPDTTLPLLDQLPNHRETKDHFKFLSVFKWEARKGWDILARSFYEEFKKEDNVTLYLLTNAFHAEDGLNFTEEVHKIGQQICETEARSVDSLPRVIMIDKHVPQKDLPRLYKSVDAFVLPTRGEGWGRPIAEAMSMGLPAIATAWSGPTQFMNDTNSYPLPIEGLSQITQPPWNGHYWAEPSVSALRRLMREVVSNPEEARRRGANARADALHRWSPAAVGRLALRRLAHIYRNQRVWPATVH